MSQYYLPCLLKRKRKTMGVSLLMISLLSISACKDKQVDDVESQPIAIPSEYAIEAADLSEAKGVLVEYIQTLNAVELLAESDISLNLSVGPQTAQEKPQYRSETLVLPPADAIEKSAKAYVDVLVGDMAQSFEPPNSQVSLFLQSARSNTLSDKLYSVANTRLTKVSYRNGEVNDTPVTENKTATRGINFTVPSAAIIDTIQVESTISYPLTYTALTFNKAQTEHHIDELVIRYERVDEETVRLIYPAEINERILYVEGYHANGKALEQSYHSAKSLPEAEAMAYLKNVNALYKKALEKLNKNHFSNVVELKAYINKKFPRPVVNPHSITTEIYRFAGNVADIKLIAISKEKSTLSKRFEIKHREFNEQSYFVAWDHSAKKFGLIDTNGDWTVKPQYQHLLHNVDDYYQNGMSGQNYWFDQENKQLTAVDYEPKEILSDSLQVVKKVASVSSSQGNSAQDGSTQNSSAQYSSSHNKRGVIHTRTREVLVPFEYAEINTEENMIIATKRDENSDELQAVYSHKGELVLPGHHFGVDIENGIIYAADIKQPVIKMAFAASGEKLTPEAWNAVGTFNDELLLVEKCEEAYKVCQKGFINKVGEFAFSVEQYKALDFGLFSHGYAAIRNDEGLWGYINKKGRLTIPFKYKDASRFHQKYALVTAKNGDEMLIDKKGRVFKNFKKTIVNRYYSSDQPTIYTLKDGSRYNGNGERLSGE